MIPGVSTTAKPVKTRGVMVEVSRERNKRIYIEGINRMCNIRDGHHSGRFVPSCALCSTIWTIGLSVRIQLHLHALCVGRNLATSRCTVQGVPARIHKQDSYAKKTGGPGL